MVFITKKSLSICDVPGHVRGLIFLQVGEHNVTLTKNCLHLREGLSKSKVATGLGQLLISDPSAFWVGRER